MDLSILDYKCYGVWSHSWEWRIGCEGFDFNGYPIYHFSRVYDQSFRIYYDTGKKKWFGISPSGDHKLFIFLKAPRRFRPIPEVKEGAGQTVRVRCFTKWSEAHSLKIVPFNWINYKNAHTKTKWRVEDISMIILVMALRLRIHLPGEMLEAILRQLDIIR